MDRNRKSYVEATDRLVCFLDEVTSALQSTSSGGHGGTAHAHRRLLESTRAEVSRVTAAKRATAAKRLSLDSVAMRLAKAESMPGEEQITEGTFIIREQNCGLLSANGERPSSD